MFLVDISLVYNKLTVIEPVVSLWLSANISPYIVLAVARRENPASCLQSALLTRAPQLDEDAPVFLYHRETENLSTWLFANQVLMNIT